MNKQLKEMIEKQIKSFNVEEDSVVMRIETTIEYVQTPQGTRVTATNEIDGRG